MTSLFIVVNVDWFFLSHRKEIALAALNNGYDVTIVTADTGKRKEIENLGLKFINLPMSRSVQGITSEIRTFLFLYSLYKEKKPDIVHHVGIKTILWGSLAAKQAKVHGVVNAISGLGTIFSQGKKSFLSKMIFSVLRYSHRRNNVLAIFQNDEDKTLFLDHNIIKTDQVRKTNGSGIDLDVFSYIPEPPNGKIRIILTARMIKEKGIFILIEAANFLKDKYKDKIQFLICGGLDDSPQAITRNELENACDADYIQWLGYRTDVLDLLKSSHIVAFPSYYKEGLPKSLIEASAVGRPIITTDSIGCRETVVDGYNGFLIPIKDSKVLADKLDLLIKNPELRQKMGQNSRKLAEEKFSIDEVTKTHLEIYSTLTESITI